MTTCTFDGTTVPSSELPKINPVGTYSFECTLRCRTTSFSAYTALTAKAGTTRQPGTCAIGTVVENGKVSVQSYGGTLGTLVLNGVTYTNCYIQTISGAEVPRSNLSVWEFTISFIRDTTL